MAHETLKALYEMDVEAFGREKANSFWEFLEDFTGHRTWSWLSGAPFWEEGCEYRRRRDAPWPWDENAKRLEARIKELEAKLAAVEMLAAADASTSAEWQRLCEKEKANDMNEWPDDAPENANYMFVSFHEFRPEVRPCLSFTLLTRPQPRKRKIDWNQLAPWVKQYWPNQSESGGELPVWPVFPSCWIPWNVPGCRDDMDVWRECPVPDGVVVEVKFASGSISAQATMPWFNWMGLMGRANIVAFRIIGIADGRE